MSIVDEVINDALSWVKDVKKSFEEITGSYDDYRGTNSPKEDRIFSDHHSNQKDNVLLPTISLNTLDCWQNCGLFFSSSDICEEYYNEFTNYSSTVYSYNGKDPRDCIYKGLREYNNNNDYDDNKMNENFFPVDEELNYKLYFFVGDMCRLDVDAIVCFSSEGSMDLFENSGRILAIGGQELLEDLHGQERCRSGEARITKAYNLPCRYIIHTVGPKYSEKYAIAAHNTLNSCYKEILALSVEHGIRTIAIPCLYPYRKRSIFPMIDFGHTAFRTLRRWLELLRHKIDAIILCCGTGLPFLRDCSATSINYSPNRSKEILSFSCYFAEAYFPRNKQERISTFCRLPVESGNRFGEIEVSERKVRIQGHLYNQDKQVCEESVFISGKLGEKKVTPYAQDNGRDLCNKDISDGFIEKCWNDDDTDDDIMKSVDVSFTEATIGGSIAENHIKYITAMEEQGCNRIGDGFCLSEGEMAYAYYWRESRKEKYVEDFLKIAKYRFIYYGGKDRAQRNILVFCAALFPSHLFPWKSLLLYIIKAVDLYVQDKHVFIYVNSKASIKSNGPAISLIRDALAIYSARYQKKLDLLLILHPGLFFKMAFSLFWPFVPSNIWSGTKYLQKISELQEYCDVKQLELPRYVIEYDAKVTGSFMSSMFKISS